MHVCVFERVCPPLRLLITSGMMWHDITSYNWSNRIYSCYKANVVGIVDGQGLGIDTHRGN